MRKLALLVLIMLATTAQDRSPLPVGEWCQRATGSMSKQAHPCACKKHDCLADDRDPNNRSAHTDPTCASYCHVDSCRCLRTDCE
jgi:hypothetical protein